ncbi:hypothetical protein D3C84_353540 [compost metagenome]
MSLHEDLIGAHPPAPHEFARWMDCSDIEPTDARCHRALTSKLTANEPALVQWLAEKLVHHHYDQTRIERLKQKYTDFPSMLSKIEIFQGPTRQKKGMQPKFY